MQLIEDRAIARGMIRVDAGEDMLSALEALAVAAGWSDAFVTGTGRLDLVELEVGGESRSLERAEIVAMSGRFGSGGTALGPMLHAQVLVDGQLHVGRVTAALTGPLLLVVEAEVRAPRGGLAPARSPEPPARTALPSSPSDAVATVPSPRASAPGAGTVAPRVPVPRPRHESMVDDAEEEHWAEVAAGDRLEHPQLGLCEVVGDDEAGGAKVRLASGRVCVLRLDTLEVSAPREDAAGTRVFRVLGPKRRR